MQFHFLHVLSVSPSVVYPSDTNIFFYSLGLFSVTPSNGEALTTEFEFKASEGWSDADGDALKFQFSYTKEDGTTFFYSPQEESSFKTQLPTGTTFVRNCNNVQ